MVILCVIFWGTIKLFSSVAESFYIPTSNIWSFHFIHILANTCYFLFKKNFFFFNIIAILVCVKRYFTLADTGRMDKKHDPTLCCLKEMHTRSRPRNRLKVKGWKKMSHANRNQKRAGVAVLISDKIDFKSKMFTRDKDIIYWLLQIYWLL